MLPDTCRVLTDVLSPARSCEAPAPALEQGSFSTPPIHINDGFFFRQAVYKAHKQLAFRCRATPRGFRFCVEVTLLLLAAAHLAAAAALHSLSGLPEPQAPPEQPFEAPAGDSSAGGAGPGEALRAALRDTWGALELLEVTAVAPRPPGCADVSVAKGSTGTWPQWACERHFPEVVRCEFAAEAAVLRLPRWARQRAYQAAEAAADRRQQLASSSGRQTSEPSDLEEGERGAVDSLNSGTPTLSVKVEVPMPTLVNQWFDYVPGLASAILSRHLLAAFVRGPLGEEVRRRQAIANETDGGRLRAATRAATEPADGRLFDTLGKHGAEYAAADAAEAPALEDAQVARPAEALGASWFELFFMGPLPNADSEATRQAQALAPAPAPNSSRLDWFGAVFPLWGTPRSALDAEALRTGQDPPVFEQTPADTDTPPSALLAFVSCQGASVASLQPLRLLAELHHCRAEWCLFKAVWAWSSSVLALGVGIVMSQAVRGSLVAFFRLGQHWQKQGSFLGFCSGRVASNDDAAAEGDAAGYGRQDDGARDTWRESAADGRLDVLECLLVVASPCLLALAIFRWVGGARGDIAVLLFFHACGEVASFTGLWVAESKYIFPRAVALVYFADVFYVVFHPFGFPWLVHGALGCFQTFLLVVLWGHFEAHASLPHEYPDQVAVEVRMRPKTTGTPEQHPAAMQRLLLSQCLLLLGNDHSHETGVVVSAFVSRSLQRLYASAFGPATAGLACIQPGIFAILPPLGPQPLIVAERDAIGNDPERCETFFRHVQARLLTPSGTTLDQLDLRQTRLSHALVCLSTGDESDSSSDGGKLGEETEEALHLLDCFIATLERCSVGAPLGIDVEPSPRHQSLIITKIQGPSVAAWNRENPGHEIRLGTHILAVNGAHGDCRLLLNAIKRSQRLVLILQQRRPADTSAGSSTTPHAGSSNVPTATRKSTADVGTQTDPHVPAPPVVGAAASLADKSDFGATCNFDIGRSVATTGDVEPETSATQVFLQQLPVEDPRLPKLENRPGVDSPTHGDVSESPKPKPAGGSLDFSDFGGLEDGPNLARACYFEVAQSAANSSHAEPESSATRVPLQQFAVEKPCLPKLGSRLGLTWPSTGGASESLEHFPAQENLDFASSTDGSNCVDSGCCAKPEGSAPNALLRQVAVEAPRLQKLGSHSSMASPANDSPELIPARGSLHVGEFGGSEGGPISGAASHFEVSSSHADPQGSAPQVLLLRLAVEAAGPPKLGRSSEGGSSEASPVNDSPRSIPARRSLDLGEFAADEGFSGAAVEGGGAGGVDSMEASPVHDSPRSIPARRSLDLGEFAADQGFSGAAVEGDGAGGVDSMEECLVKPVGCLGCGENPAIAPVVERPTPLCGLMANVDFGAFLGYGEDAGESPDVGVEGCISTAVDSDSAADRGRGRGTDGTSDAAADGALGGGSAS